MNRRRHSSPAIYGYALLAAFALLGAAGCNKSAGTLSIVSYADPYFPETIETNMSQAVYRTDSGGDIHLACHSQADLHNPENVTAWLQVHVYWHPKPGKTHDDPSSADATIRYLVITPHGARLYTGSAFIYPRVDRSSGELLARIESARLQPVASEGQAPDSLGETKLSGMLKARLDRAATVDLVGEMNRITPQLETTREQP